MTAVLTVLVPVLNRPHRVRPLLRNLRESVVPDSVEILFLANDSDMEEINALKEAGSSYVALPDAQISWASKINEGFRRTKTPYCLLGADDIEFSFDWYEAMKPFLSDATPGGGVIGTSDGSGRLDIHSAHPIVSRRYVEHYGTFDQIGLVVHEGYRHWCPDTELCETAILRNEYKSVPSCVLFHRHFLRGAPMDSTYALGQSFVERDRHLFVRRMTAMYKQFGCEERTSLMRSWIPESTLRSMDG